MMDSLISRMALDFIFIFIFVFGFSDREFSGGELSLGTRRLPAAATGFTGRVGAGRGVPEFLLALSAAKVEVFAVALGMQSIGFIHRHPADGILRFSFLIIHNV